jgi:hypothetical protein
MVATTVFAAHVTDLVTLAMLPSEHVPVAVNCGRRSQPHRHHRPQLNKLDRAGFDAFDSGALLYPDAAVPARCDFEHAAISARFRCRHATLCRLS